MSDSTPSEIDRLVEQRYVFRRKHPFLPLWIYNYTARAQELAVKDWSPALQACRGLILDENGDVIGRPFRKFWNYEQILNQIPAGESFTVWEKLDGSLGIVCSYRDELVVATRGSFDSPQALWANQWLKRHAPSFLPSGQTFLFEIIYPGNRIVVDYGDRAELILLTVMNQDGTDDDDSFESCQLFEKVKRFEGLTDFSIINALPELSGQEGLVIRWESGFRAKLKLEEYRRLHRLITQCSTRTIWEILRANKSTDELMDHVPEDFRVWAASQIADLRSKHQELTNWAIETRRQMHFDNRKEFAEAAKRTAHPGLLFLLLDGRDISDAAWKIIEPEWACPFKKDEE